MAIEPVTDISTTAELAEGEALPRAAAVHSDPEAPASAEQKPLPRAMSRRPVKEKSEAEWAYERVILYIRNFEEQLDSAEEVAMGFAGGDAGVLQIEGVGFFEPDILTFYGYDEDGLKTQLIQHVSQLNVVLRAIPKLEPEEPARRIGFQLERGWLGGDAGDGSA
ncbi:DUF6173 family protein [Thioclava sp. FR2]|uniref:DUF6173 family protein n=1 Tax=Thioclava sp. FR2 TaxID=3445780 RepID=UPI003EBA451D